MNVFFIYSLGSYIIAAAYLNINRSDMSVVWLILATISALLGQVIYKNDHK